MKWINIFVTGLLVFPVTILSAQAVPSRPTADLVLWNGKIVTLDEGKPGGRALAVAQGKILAVGSDPEIKAYITPATQVIDVKGALVIPGLIESHGHFLGLGYSRMRLDLTKTKNYDDIVEMVRQAAQKAKPGEWIIGRGWHQEKWDKVPQPSVDGLPVHRALSLASPDNPVLLTHATGHSSMTNAKGMELAGITGQTPNPPGGEIIKDSQGNPIGILLETAQDILDKKYAEYQARRNLLDLLAEDMKAVELATQVCLSRGITSFHDAGVSFSTIDLYKDLAGKGKLGIRLYAMIGENNQGLAQQLDRYKIIGLGDNRLTVRSIKRLIDGALGSHGAWLFEPYLSLPGSTGLNTEPVGVMKETAAIAMEKGFQLCTHAIGDRANRETLDIYEQAFKLHPGIKDCRWRIEHAQHLHPADIPRFGKLGVIAAMQGVHCTSDGPFVIKRLGGKRSQEGAYAWRSLLDSGALICNGTDTPVEEEDPIACFYASVTRKLKDGTRFFPGQEMTRLEALRSYTLNGAYAAFEEGIKGSLTPGKLADITVLSQDILTVPEEDILKTDILYTILAGQVVYSSPGKR